jgi:hypothetical protein
VGISWMLLDEFMPLYQFSENHSIVIKIKSNSNVLSVIKDIKPAEIPFMFELLWLHALPSRLFSTKKKSDLEIVRKKPFFEQYLNSGFILLAEDENQELVLGRIAQFWKLINDSVPRIDNTHEFLAFNNPSYAKAAMNFYVHRNHADDEDIKFSTETRIYVHDQIARKKFARYWFVIHSFSAFSRKMLLSSKAAVGD